MKVYHFDTFAEQGMFVDFCTANNIPVEFDTRDKSATVLDDKETETDHFFDYYHEYQMEMEEGLWDTDGDAIRMTDGCRSLRVGPTVGVSTNTY